MSELVLSSTFNYLCNRLFGVRRLNTEGEKVDNGKRRSKGRRTEFDDLEIEDTRVLAPAACIVIPAQNHERFFDRRPPGRAEIATIDTRIDYRIPSPSRPAIAVPAFAC